MALVVLLYALTVVAWATLQFGFLGKDAGESACQDMSMQVSWTRPTYLEVHSNASLPSSLLVRQRFKYQRFRLVYWHHSVMVSLIPLDTIVMSCVIATSVTALTCNSAGIPYSRCWSPLSPCRIQVWSHWKGCSSPVGSGHQRSLCWSTRRTIVLVVCDHLKVTGSL